MAKATVKDVWTKAHVESLAPDATSIPAAEKVLKNGGFGTVDVTADGSGWWVVCRGLTGEYQVNVRRQGSAGRYACTCNCLSYKIPCKHALALLLYLVDHPELRAGTDDPKTAAGDFEGLLRGTFREPDDDIARGVFADFLEENGQSDRAALIRYQCEHAQLQPGTARAKELDQLIKPLAATLKKQIGPLPENMKVQFVRGFVRLEAYMNHFMDVGSFPTRLINLFRDGWIETLALPLAGELDTDARPLLAQVGELDVSRYGLTDDFLLALATATAKARTDGRLTRVKVHSSNRKAFDHILQIQQGKEADTSADLEPVRGYYQLNTQTFRQLLRFGRLSGARDLFISCGVPFGEAEVEALLTADLSITRYLGLYGWAFTRTAMEALASAPDLTKLTTLQLRACRINGQIVSALVASPLFAVLKTLDLSENRLGKPAVESLMEVEVPAKLKELHLQSCQLQPGDKRRLKRKYGKRVKT